MDAVLDVGDPVRRTAGVAVVVSLVSTGLFAGVMVIAKELPVLYRAQPWREDPYDALVSLDVLVLPLLVVAGAARVRLCRRLEPLPVRRLLDLLRLCTLVVGLVLLTEGAEWTATAFGARLGSDSTAATGQVIALAMFSAVSIGAALMLRRARGSVRDLQRHGEQPDWLADATTFVVTQTRGFPPLHRRAVPLATWLDTHVAVRVRRHPLATAGSLAVGMSAPVLAAKLVVEGYPPGLAVYVFMVFAMSLFGFFVLTGSYLHVVAGRAAGTSVRLSVGVAACLGGPVTAAFRHDALALVGAGHAPEHLSTLVVLTACGSLAAAALTLVLAPVALRRHERRTSSRGGDASGSPPGL